MGEITSESGRGYSHDGTPRDRAPLVVGVRDVTDVGNSFLLSSFIFPLHYPSVSRPTARRGGLGRPLPRLYRVSRDLDESCCRRLEGPLLRQ